MVSRYLSLSRRLTNQCQLCLYLLLALLSGTVLPIQANLNAQLARSLESVPLAADISYLTGAIVLLAALLTRRFGQPDWSALAKAPRWSLLGGVLGVWYITSSTYFISVLGTTLTLGLVVGGQAIAGVVVDHYGWLGVPRQRFSSHRQVALGLLIVALFLLSQSR